VGRKKAKWKLLGFALMVGAVITEMRKPPEEREWHGRVLGVVPYDFRTPTFDRFKRSMWNPEDDRLFTPNAFGVGWSPNLAQIFELLKAARGDAPQT
jgi:hypothetical protein